MELIVSAIFEPPMLARKSFQGNVPVINLVRTLMKTKGVGSAALPHSVPSALVVEIADLRGWIRRGTFECDFCAGLWRLSWAMTASLQRLSYWPWTADLGPQKPQKP